MTNRNMTQSQAILIEVSPGELWDKITILRIKAVRIADEAKLKNVRIELTMLESAATRATGRSTELDALIERLCGINESLWNIEDDIRRCERENDFGPKFIELARSVYRLNDERGRNKRQINDLLGSAIVEEKQYADYR